MTLAQMSNECIVGSNRMPLSYEAWLRQKANIALRVGETRAASHQDPRKQLLTMQRASKTARSWLNETHPELSEAWERYISKFAV